MPTATSLQSSSGYNKTERVHLQEKERTGRYTQTYVSPNEILRDCLFNSFGSVNDLRDFCFFCCEPLHKELREGDGFARIVTLLIKHHTEHNIVEDLWTQIRKQRPRRYEEYYPLWRQAVDNGGLNAPAQC